EADDLDRCSLSIDSLVVCVLDRHDAAGDVIPPWFLCSLLQQQFDFGPFRTAESPDHFGQRPAFGRNAVDFEDPVTLLRSCGMSRAGGNNSLDPWRKRGTGESQSDPDADVAVGRQLLLNAMRIRPRDAISA